MKAAGEVSMRDLRQAMCGACGLADEILASLARLRPGSWSYKFLASRATFLLPSCDCEFTQQPPKQGAFEHSEC